MSEKFNPSEHMTKLQGKDYLEVAPRVAWFRSEHPGGRITTQFITAGDYLIAQATVTNNDNHILAQGSATVRAWAKGGAPRDIEKAETAAIGRALAFAGFGTLQAGDDISEGDHLADAPREVTAERARKNLDKASTPANGGVSPETSDDTTASEQAPAAFIARIMSDQTVQSTWKAPTEARATIHKMWREGELTADTSDPDAILAVIDRLKAHRKNEQLPEAV